MIFLTVCNLKILNHIQWIGILVHGPFSMRIDLIWAIVWVPQISSVVCVCVWIRIQSSGSVLRFGQNLIGQLMTDIEDSYYWMWPIISKYTHTYNILHCPAYCMMSCILPSSCNAIGRFVFYFNVYHVISGWDSFFAIFVLEYVGFFSIC